MNPFKRHFQNPRGLFPIVFLAVCPRINYTLWNHFDFIWYYEWIDRINHLNCAKLCFYLKSIFNTNLFSFDETIRILRSVLLVKCFVYSNKHNWWWHTMIWISECVYKNIQSCPLISRVISKQYSIYTTTRAQKKHEHIISFHWHRLATIEYIRYIIVNT